MISAQDGQAVSGGSPAGSRIAFAATESSVSYDLGRSDERSIAVVLTYAFWILMIAMPDWFLTKTIGGPFFRLPTLLAPVLALMVLTSWDRMRVYWPMVLFVLLHVAASFLSENQGLSRDALKFMLYMLLLFAASVTFLCSPSRMIVVLKLYLLTFVWFGIQGLSDGRVHWHYHMNNEDSYGPLMAMGSGFSYFLARAVLSHRWRVVAQGTCLLGVLGVVVSFARGAALAAGAVMFLVWLRSPRRLATLTHMVLAGLVLVSLAGALVPLDRYVERIKTTFSEGTAAGNGQQRWILWQMGAEVFLQSPLWGVGAGNFGVVASEIIPNDPARPQFADVRKVYSFSLHNDYMEILCEEGIIGISLWIGMIVGFFRRISRLRTQGAMTWWSRRGGEDVDLRMIANGLEGAMIGYLVSSVFYANVYIYWFWSLVTIAYVLEHVSSPSEEDTGSDRLASNGQHQNETEEGLLGLDSQSSRSSWWSAGQASNSLRRQHKVVVPAIHVGMLIGRLITRERWPEAVPVT